MPKGQYNRIRKAGAQEVAIAEDSRRVADAIDAEVLRDVGAAEPQPPSFWGRGALLNVRTTGGDYIVTLYPEEYDPRSPERAMRFANPALCQNFVSQWYSRQSHDPRAW